jgi:hypothetical protein
VKRTLRVIAASAIMMSPSLAVAQAPGQGQNNGQGYWHTNGPESTGQPGAECGEENALNRPGQAESAPGSAFNPDGNAGTHYAGEQPQNSRNSASVSQYDVACLHQPQ